ncbi:helix-turn-helix domain-containing protein [Brevibacillus reuszeri]|uniref:helix-turn-helix domain-containing protein n=1 Tax=Brevibacillus reuszeri TaxID=54915 RepID=UPI000CCBEDC7|nr:XRE family transcriptional regulator [Brevibacillus reuszeri]
MDDIHKKIKEIRLEQGLTLKDLSEKTSLSVSFLSQIERGASSVAITSLKKIADAFGVTMTFFFEEQVHSNYHVKAEQQKPFQVEGSATSFVRLGGEFPKRSLEPMIVKLAPNQKKEQTFSHPGEEFYFVLKGSALFEIAGEEYFVRQGESIHFPSHIEHEYENPLNEETMLLCVLTPVIF